MSPIRSLSLIALFFVAITLAGCGGSGSPSEEVVTQKGTTKLLVENTTGFDGTFYIGGASFKLGGHQTLTLYNMQIGRTYNYLFKSLWSDRGDSVTISGISSNYLLLE